MDSEIPEITDFRWSLTRDGSLSLSVNHQHRILSPSYPYMPYVLKYCRSEQPVRVLAYSNIGLANRMAEKHQAIAFCNGKWCYNNRPLRHDISVAVDALMWSDLPAGIVDHAFRKFLFDKTIEKMTVENSPIESALSAEVSFYGWFEYARRNNGVTLDTQDDFERGSYKSLVDMPSKQTRVLLVAHGSSLLASARVPTNVKTCKEAMDWLSENDVSQYSAITLATQSIAIRTSSFDNSRFRRSIG